MDFEGIIVELERHHLIGKLDAFCRKVNLLHNCAQNSVRVLGIRAWFNEVVHWKSKKASIWSYPLWSPTVKPYPFFWIGMSWSQETNSKTAARISMFFISRLLIVLADDVFSSNLSKKLNIFTWVRELQIVNEKNLLIFSIF